MRFAQRWTNPARFAMAVLFGLVVCLGALGLRAVFDRLALDDERDRSYHGLILAIGDVISHGFLHEVPFLLVPVTKVVLDRPRTLGDERHSISDRGDRNQRARALRETGQAGPGFVELPASNAAPFTEPNADCGHSS